MADGVFSAEVVTPEQRLVSGPARAVVLRSSDGFLTILDGHTDLVTDIVPGEVRVEAEDGTVTRLAVHGGYLQVQTGAGVADDDGGGAQGGGAQAGGTRSTRATVLAGVAEPADGIDVARAEQAKAAAEERIAALQAAGGREGARTGAEGETSAEDVELADARAALLRAEVRLQVAGAAAGTPAATHA